jgi:hypothetical protein
MPSAFATYFNATARLLLWNTHKETVAFRYANALAVPVVTTLEGVWKRLIPRDGADSDGYGLTTYTGLATFVVKREGFPDDAKEDAEIDRIGETWAIRHIEPQDEQTYILHLARPEADVRMPGRGR